MIRKLQITGKNYGPPKLKVEGFGQDE